MIEYLKMDLFDVPKGSVIVHACNSMGVWGSGIAAEFKRRYPASHLDYQEFCRVLNDRRGTATARAGTSQCFPEPHHVAWIVTSHNYGDKKDDSEQIKINTTLALNDLCTQLTTIYSRRTTPTIYVYSNKFNSGLFGVHWEDSELILRTILRDFERINWRICDPQ